MLFIFGTSQNWFLFQIETLLSYGYDAKSTHLQSALFHRDWSDSCDQNKTKSGDAKSGYYKRKQVVEKSLEVPFCTQLHIDFLTCSRWLPPGVPMKLKMIRNDDNFVIVAETGTYKIKFLSLNLEFQKIIVDPKVTQRELQKLHGGDPYRMPFLMSKQITHTIPSGRSSFQINDLYTGMLPRQLILCFVRHDSYNADITKNGYIFENLNITNLVFKVNGENIPSTEYRPDFTAANVDCVREYQHFLDSIGIKRLNSGVGITIQDFATHCCFWILDLTPEKCNNNHVHIGINGTIALAMTFGTQTPTNYQLMGYGVYPVQAVIDKDMNCTLVDNI